MKSTILARQRMEADAAHSLHTASLSNLSQDAFVEAEALREPVTVRAQDRVVKKALSLPLSQPLGSLVHLHSRRRSTPGAHFQGSSQTCSVNLLCLVNCEWMPVHQVPFPVDSVVDFVARAAYC